MSGASRVVSMILAWKVIYPVVRQLTHEGSFPLSPQTAFPNREVIKELSTTLRFTSSGVLPRFYQEPVIQMLFFVTALIQSLQDTER